MWICEGKKRRLPTFSDNNANKTPWSGGIEELGRISDLEKKEEFDLVMLCRLFLNIAVPSTFSLDASHRETQFPQNCSFPRSAVATCSARAAKHRKSPTQSRPESWLCWLKWQTLLWGKHLSQVQITDVTFWHKYVGANQISVSDIIMSVKWCDCGNRHSLNFTRKHYAQKLSTCTTGGKIPWELFIPNPTFVHISHFYLLIPERTIS